jgi:uncharacterized protein (TIGR03000 family)
MRLLTVLVLLCAGTAHADDPAAKARASWAWATAKAEPTKTAWAVTDTKTPCPLCNGVAGKVCRDCGGNGYVTDLPKQEAKPARLEVTLPADATLWIDGQATRAVGTLRTFVSPPIDRESMYHLTVQIPGEYAQTEDVKVWPGKTSKISFASIDRIPAQQFRGYWAPAAPMLNGGAECVGGT